MQEHPFASACDGIEDPGRYVNRCHGIIVHADGHRAMHHRRFARDVQRAIPHEDEQTTHGPAVLEGEHQDPVDEARENDLPGHALDHPNDRRKIRRLVHQCAACAGGMPHLRAPAEPTTGRAAPVLDVRRLIPLGWVSRWRHFAGRAISSVELAYGI
jgi:hypothetical protein